MQTKQELRDEFEAWTHNYPWNTELGRCADFWLQKQDQLLTELGEKIKKEQEVLYSPNRSYRGCYQEGLDKALSLINKFK